MQLRPEQLDTHLQQQLLPLYLVSGDETLLVQEAGDAIRAAARSQGCSEREVLQVEGKFDWNGLLASACEMSLFSERKIIELRIPSGKPGTEGSKALLHYLKDPSPDNILLIIAGKIDKQSRNSKWFKALDKAGVTVQVWPPDRRKLPQWLQGRLQKQGLAIEPEALQVLCERVEGNLLAAQQEIQKLRLTAIDDRVSLADVDGTVANNARFSLFGMVDQALEGNPASALKMLYGLRGEGTEAAVILWVLARELRLLYQCQGELARGQQRSQVLRNHRVWDSRTAIVEAALKRHSLPALTQLLRSAALADRTIKGLGEGKPWDRLSALVLQLSSTDTSANASSQRLR
jgi:DNA polymerase-3 subunit delta